MVAWHGFLLFFRNGTGKTIVNNDRLKKRVKCVDMTKVLNLTQYI